MERFIRWTRRGLALAVLAPLAVTGRRWRRRRAAPEVLDPDLAVRTTVSGLDAADLDGLHRP